MNAPPPLPHTLDIDDSGGTINAVWAMLHPLGILPDINTDCTPGDTRIFSQLHPPLPINEHKHPFGVKNTNSNIFLNSVLQLIFSIFRNNSYTSPFNSSTEGTLLKCPFQTAHNVAILKMWMRLNFNWYIMIHFIMVKINRIVPKVFWCW